MGADHQPTDLVSVARLALLTGHREGAGGRAEVDQLDYHPGRDRHRPLGLGRHQDPRPGASSGSPMPSTHAPTPSPTAKPQ